VSDNDAPDGSPLFGVCGPNLIPGLAIDHAAYAQALHTERCKVRRMSRDKRRRYLAGRAKAFRGISRSPIERAFPQSWNVSPIVQDFVTCMQIVRRFRDGAPR